MRRVISVWLKAFAIERLQRRTMRPPKRPNVPFALVSKDKGGLKLKALNEAAKALGLRLLMPLTDARAIAPDLLTEPHDKDGERRDLLRLAAWLRFYSPSVAAAPPDEILLDMTGACHLFGGEEATLSHLIGRLHRAGFTARAGLAGTYGAARALARFSPTAATVIAPGEERARLASLPCRALKLGEEHLKLLDLLGLATIGHVLALPRQTLRARFGLELTTALDEALGEAGEAGASLPLERTFGARTEFGEPVTQMSFIEKVADRLLDETLAQLAEAGQGARAFRLSLYDTQGGCQHVSATTLRASVDKAHILRVLRERLGAMEGRLPDFAGFDAASLYAGRTEPLTPSEPKLWEKVSARADPSAFAALVDRLQARLGPEAVARFEFHESRIPERASLLVPIRGEPPAKGSEPPRDIGELGPRPLFILPRPEPLSVLAEIPDYPPRRFVWRKITYRVVGAEGPERIAPEWWRDGKPSAPPRDYYRVETEGGRRFWLYREGFYGEGGPPRWYLQGFFP